MWYVLYIDYTDILVCVCVYNFRDGTIDVHEFEALWKYVQEWRDCFERYSISLLLSLLHRVTLRAGKVGGACVNTAVFPVFYIL